MKMDTYFPKGRTMRKRDNGRRGGNGGFVGSNSPQGAGTNEDMATAGINAVPTPKKAIENVQKLGTPAKATVKAIKD